MSKFAMFGLSAAAALLFAIVASVATGAHGDLFLLLPFVLGRAIAIFGMGWAVAGVIYLLSGRSMSRGSLIYISILVAVALAYSVYSVASFDGK